MLSGIKAFFLKYWDIILYFIFGVITTLVNFTVYYPLYNVFHISAAISNVIAWFAAVAVAFITNKQFVFKSKDWSYRVLLSELCKFVGSRIGSGLVETIILHITVDFLLWNGNITKLLISVIVIVLNYITSKCIVFRDDQN